MSLYGSLQSKTAFINHGKHGSPLNAEYTTITTTCLKRQETAKRRDDDLSVSVRRANRDLSNRRELSSSKPSAFSTDDRYTGRQESFSCFDSIEANHNGTK